MASPLMDDNPAREDLLGFSRLTEVLVEVIRDHPRLPFTIGIFAEWGSGKTTLMEMIRERLADDGVKTVWFNAWKYDSKEIIWNALIQTIFYTISQDESVKDARDGAKLRGRVKHMASGLARYAAKVATRFVPGGIVREEDVDGVIQALTTSATDPAFSFINEFEQEFDKLVCEYVGEDGVLVVFIDDLDRCLPENAINAMEALKLYLDKANCVFVVGAERSIVEEGIRQRYKGNSNLSAEDYLDKIIQLPFVLPRTGTEHAMSLLGVNQQDNYDANMKNLIIEGTGGNPRRVKRFANAFWVLSKIAGELEPADANRLGKVLMIQMRFPRLFDQLVDDHELVDAMTRALAGDSSLRTRVSASSAQVEQLFDDAEMKRFLNATSAISMESDEVERWIRLASAYT
jgi:hypothetical protein